MCNKGKLLYMYKKKCLLVDVKHRTEKCPDDTEKITRRIEFGCVCRL